MCVCVCAVGGGGGKLFVNSQLTLDNGNLFYHFPPVNATATPHLAIPQCQSHLVRHRSILFAEPIGNWIKGPRWKKMWLFHLYFISFAPSENNSLFGLAAHFTAKSIECSSLSSICDTLHRLSDFCTRNDTAAPNGMLWYKSVCFFFFFCFFFPSNRNKIHFHIISVENVRGLWISFRD